MKTPIRVMLVDDNVDAAELLGYLIAGDVGMKWVGSLRSANALRETVRDLSPDVLVLDARMPGKDSMAALRELAVETPNVRTIVYSGFDDSQMIDEAIDAGAWGWVRKGDDPVSIIRAIRTVSAGKPVFPHHSELVGA